MIIDQGDKEVQNTSLNKYALACALVASMVSIVSGYDTSVMSGAMIFIKEDLGISDTQQEILAGILNVCALVGSLTAGRTSDVIGRRYTIFLASILFIIGAILMGYGPNYAVIIPYDDVELLKICFRVVERICDHLEEIDIVRFGTNNLLECITDNYNIGTLIARFGLYQGYRFNFALLTFSSGLFAFFFIFWSFIDQFTVLVQGTRRNGW
ncbi:unnamed protein product [Vicia faba]|uniref:Major facilitator superfamily (MFS) profile domain-containing protein n=1 Tax=Vicia faba TaxID=3906 RepID=A0AAV1ADW6_VICFA|nr:unnamed protein product [Vicia faba]